MNRAQHCNSQIILKADAAGISLSTQGNQNGAIIGSNQLANKQYTDPSAPNLLSAQISQHAQQQFLSSTQSMNANIVNALDNVPNYKFSCFMLVMLTTNFIICIMTEGTFRILCLSETCVVQNAVLIYSIASFVAYLLMNLVIGKLSLVYLQPFQVFLFYPTNQTYVQRFHAMCIAFLGFLCPLVFPILTGLFVIILIRQRRTRKWMERQLKPLRNTSQVKQNNT